MLQSLASQAGERLVLYIPDGSSPVQLVRIGTDASVQDVNTPTVRCPSRHRQAQMVSMSKQQPLKAS